MTDPSISRPGRGALGLMVGAGMLGAVVIILFTGDRLFNSEAGYAAIVIQSTVLALVVGFALWWTRSRLWRAFAVGLISCWAVFLVLFALVWTSNDPAPSPGGSPSLPSTTRGPTVAGL